MVDSSIAVILGPVLGVAAVVLGTLLTGWFQSRTTRQQIKGGHEKQVELLNLRHEWEEELRERQFAEADRADRLLIIEYIDLLLPRLCEVASIKYLARDNLDPDELSKYLQLQQYIRANEMSQAHPERTLGHRMTFLVFQLVAGMGLALNARWTRPLSREQTQFLRHWESHIEPIICSGRYPGKELLYREQLEMIRESMLLTPETTRLTRPLNWGEFVSKYEADETWRELCNIVWERLRFIFEEDKSLPPRKAMQTRLAIMALYLIRMSEEAESKGWAWREPHLWRIIKDWFQWELKESQNPSWYVFERGDVATRIEDT